MNHLITGNNTFSDQTGETPLSMACANGHLEACKVIIERVKDRNPPNHLVPFEMAIRNGDLNYCKLVLEYFDITRSQGIEFQSVKL